MCNRKQEHTSFKNGDEQETEERTHFMYRVTILTERLPTLFTYIRFLSIETSIMYFRTFLCTEHFCIFVAHIRFFPNLSSFLFLTVTDSALDFVMVYLMISMATQIQAMNRSTFLYMNVSIIQGILTQDLQILVGKTVMRKLGVIQ